MAANESVVSARAAGFGHSALWLRSLTMVLALSAVALLCFVPIATSDFWLQAAIGRVIWTSGEIPRTALFPFTEARDFPSHAHEWLASVALYLLDSRLGHEKLIFVKGLLGLGLFALVARLAYRLTRGFTASLVLGLAGMLVLNYRFWLCPDLFALIFMALMLYFHVGYQLTGRRRELLACLPVAMLWANCHGSAPLALLLGASFTAGAAVDALRDAMRRNLAAVMQAARPYAACTFGMALAMLLNPYGPGVFRFVWRVYEWMPTLSPSFIGTRGFWAFAGYLGIAVPAVGLAWKRLPAAALLLVAQFTILGLLSQRYIAFFAVVSPYPLALALRDAVPRLERSLRLGAAMLALLGATTGLLVRYGNVYGAFPYFVESDNFSLLLVDYLENAPLKGNVLNSYALGAELIYRGFPKLRPAIDPRIDVYGERYFLRLQAVTHNEAAFRQFVDRYQVNYALLQRPEFDAGVRHMPGLRADGWHIAFADHKVVLLSRTTP